MAEKSDQELQKEIDFLKGQVECLTGTFALLLSIYFKLLRDTADGKIPASKLHEIDLIKALEDELSRSFDVIEERSDAVKEGFNETKNHCLQLVQTHR